MSSVLLSLTLLFLALADEVDSHSSLHNLGQNNQGLNSIAKPFWEETNSKHTHTFREADLGLYIRSKPTSCSQNIGRIWQADNGWYLLDCRPSGNQRFPWFWHILTLTGALPETRWTAWTVGFSNTPEVSWNIMKSGPRKLWYAMLESFLRLENKRCKFRMFRICPAFVLPGSPFGHLVLCHAFSSKPPSMVTVMRQATMKKASNGGQPLGCRETFFSLPGSWWSYPANGKS